MTDKPTTTEQTRPPSDRGQGRKPIPVEERAINKSMRLKPSHWEMYDQLGGVEWLRKTIEKAYKRLKQPE